VVRLARRRALERRELTQVRLSGTRSSAWALKQRTTAGMGTWERGSATAYRSGNSPGLPPMNSIAAPLPILSRAAALRSRTPARPITPVISTTGRAPAAPEANLLRPAAQAARCPPALWPIATT
jgi:hypothetical protein